MEVIEHVDNPAQFLRTCAELVKVHNFRYVPFIQAVLLTLNIQPGGHLFLSTIARTPFSYLSTILVAEKIMGMVSEGTHTHSKYINPEELFDFFGKYRSSPEGAPWITQTHRYNQSFAPLSVPNRKEAEVRGLIWEPMRNIWHLAPRSASYGFAGWATRQGNYIFWVRKPLE
jgi:polyprenyldihydroxybenzoate methyltransferase/3-demethylubiquinol 3-O-methyltransferase